MVSSSEMLDSSKDRSSAEPVSLNIDQWKVEKKIKRRTAGVRGGNWLGQAHVPL